MERGKTNGFAILSEPERRTALEALRLEGRHELADALEESFDGREIQLDIIGSIVKSVEALAGQGRRDAQRLVRSYEQVSEG